MVPSDGSASPLLELSQADSNRQQLIRKCAIDLTMKKCFGVLYGNNEITPFCLARFAFLYSIIFEPGS
jgi:hypothetical protein